MFTFKIYIEIEKNNTDDSHQNNNRFISSVLKSISNIKKIYV